MVETYETFNKTGIYNLFVYAAQTSSVFTPMLLATILFVFTLGGYFGSKRLTGQGDLFGSFVVGSLFAAVVSIFMTLKEGIINFATQATFIGIFIISLVLFYFLRDRG